MQTAEAAPSVADDPRRSERAVLGGEAEVLRVVLVLVLDPDAAASCLGEPARAEAVSLWPSSLYRVVAETALRSPSVFSRCARAVEARLERWIERYARGSAADLVEVASSHREILTGPELAAILWNLLLQHRPVLHPIARRLAAEVELIAGRRLGSSI